MKKLGFCLFLFTLTVVINKGKAQCVNFYSGTPALGLYNNVGTSVPSWSIACNASTHFIWPNQPGGGSPTNQYNTPCIRLRINPTNAFTSTDNSVTLYENGSLIGCTGPVGTCTANIGPMPNNSNYQLFASFMDPTLSHQYVLCNLFVWGPNMTYTVSSCYDNAALATGTWTTSPLGCQTVSIPAGSNIGSSTISISPFVAGAITNFFDGSAALTPSVIPPGTYTINYLFNTGNAACGLSTTSHTIVIGNPYNAAWTTPTVQCTGFSCLSLPPQVSGTGGGVFSGTGVSANSFCPGTSGAGSFPVNYSVGINATCGANLTQNINVNTTPVASAGATKTLNCIQTTTVLNGSGGTTYTWTGPGTITNGNTASPTVNTPGTFTLSVTTASCISAPTTVVVNQNTTQPVSTASTTGSITCTTTTISLTAGPGSMNYTWTAPGGSSISSGTNAVSATGQGSGTYTVNVQDPNNGCTKTATVAALINTVQPVSTASTTGSITCTTTTISLTAGPGSMNYTWTAPGGSSISSGTNAVSATGQGSGTYTVNVQDPANGCTRTATVTANINTVTPTATASTTGSITCSTNTISLGSLPAGMNYTWTAPGGSSITGGLNSQNTTGQGAGTYTVRVQSLVNGCITNTTIAAVVNTVAPTGLLPSTSGTVTCASTAINLSVLPGSMSYSWTAPAGSSITSGTTLQSATATGPGTYSVIVTNPVNGCSSQTMVAAVVNTVQPNPITGTSGSITCITNTISLTSNLSGMNYTWTAPGGSSITSGTNSQNAIGQGSGTYTINVFNPANGCSKTATVAANVNITVPATPTAAVTGSLSCAASQVTLTAIVSPTNAAVSWTPTAGICGSPNSLTTTACSAGVYSVIAIDPLSNCPSATAATVNVAPSPGSPVINTIINTGTITCTNTLITITASVTGSALSYSWTGPAVSGTSTNSVVNVTAGGLYTLVVTNSASCTASSSHSIVADNAAITPNATASNTITCISVSSTLMANPGAGSFTCNWSGPAVVGTSTLSTATASLGGVYTVTVTNTSNGCVGIGTVSVASNTTAPTGLVISPTTFTLSCATPTTVLTATATGATSYTWIAPSGGSIISGTNTASAGISGSGTYSVIVAGTNGCLSAAAEATISPNNNAPTFTISNSSPSITCLSSNPTVSVVITSTVPILSYVWTPTLGISGTSTTSIVTFTAAGTYTGVVMANNGCISNAIISVASATDAPSLVAGTGTAQVISCTNTMVTIAPTFTPTSGLTYTWTGPGIIGSTNDASVTVNQSGTYSLSVTNTLTGCASTIVTIPVVGTNIPPALNVTSSSSIGIGCLPGTSTVVLTANATPSTGVTYNWSTSAITPTISVTTASVYSVIVTDISTSCSVAVQYTVDNNVAAPSLSVVANAVMPCGTISSTTLSASSTATNITYSWTGPSIVSGSNTANPVVDQPGTYTLTVSNPTTGCTSTATVLVINGVPTASFTTDVTNGYAPLTVNFTNWSSGAISYNWNFGNGTSSAYSPQNIFSTPGTYSVVLIVTSGLCSDTTSRVIIVDNGFSIEIPNVFTPNNDGTNDLFTIKSTGVKEITLEIYNRWGQKMYEFSGAKAAWDGVSTNGNEVSAGTYFYFIKATGVDGTHYEKQGPVTLFR